MPRKVRANSTAASKPAPAPVVPTILGHEIVAPIHAKNDLPLEAYRLRPVVEDLLPQPGLLWLIREGAGLALLRTNDRARPA